LSSLSKRPGFDPRQVAVVGVDRHLPQVPVQRLTLESLLQRFANIRDWAPDVLQETRYNDHPLTPAAVLIPVIDRPVPTLLLTQRTAHLTHHSGQIALPGGKLDYRDANATEAALRETEEEIGMHRSNVQVLGTLPLYTTGSGFVITPVLAWVKPDFELQPNPQEVAEVFEIPMSFILNPSNHKRQLWIDGNTRREWYAMPYREANNERYIWGVTAGILRNLYCFLMAESSGR
jgi:8-oxo-dGTP pyrophosphatase MutT (NUDIX family)